MFFVLCFGIVITYFVGWFLTAGLFDQAGRNFRPYNYTAINYTSLDDFGSDAATEAGMMVGFIWPVSLPFVMWYWLHKKRLHKQTRAVTRCRREVGAA